MDETDIIHAFREVGKQAAHPGAGFSMLAEVILALHQLPRLPKKPKVLPLAFKGLAMHFFQLRIVIECVEVAAPATAEDLDDALCLWRKVRASGRRNEPGPRLFAA